jgi:hypothetical protein
MDWMIACCGYDCGKCKAFKGNIKNDADRQWVCDMWRKYFGLRMKPEEIYCDGCQKPDSENPKRISSACAIRCCVVKRKLENCSRCREYPCLALEKHMSSVENVDNKHRDHIPVDEYNDFIKPYLARKNLDEFRKRSG